jgi:DNA-binding transcriptional LysR family regulator
MTAATRVLNLSQPTLGRRLKNLESTLGGKLFDRVPYLALTTFGVQVFQFAQQMEDAANNVLGIAESRCRSRDTVLISTTFTMGMFLSNHLDHVAELSGLTPTVFAISTTQKPVGSGQREIDISLGSGGIYFRRANLGQVASTLYRPLEDASRRPLEEASRFLDPVGVSFIGLTNDCSSRQRLWFDRYVDSIGGSFSYRLGEVAMRHQAVRKGKGISLLPCFVGDMDPKLVRVIAPPSELDEDIYLQEGLDARGPASHVADALRRLFEQHRALMAGHQPNALTVATGATKRWNEVT